ncbi:MAG: tyrosine-type recombinase/integrase [Eubacterium sp.]|nr:tyrosine-type recombinase/integrase [Eubacterium sp.]
MTDNLITNELLKILTQNGTISVDTITAQLKKMESRQKYLDMHSHDIWLANDGYWKTKVEEDGKKRLIKKKQKSDLEDAVIEHYKGLSLNDKTFKTRYNIWIERQRICGRSGNSIMKYKSDYKRFFEGYPIENINIEDINEEILSSHILQVLQDKQIRWRAFKDIMGYVNGVFEKSVKDRVIKENPCYFLDLPIYKRYCYMPPVKTTKERTLSEDDTHTLLNRLHNPRSKNINVMSCFAIEMALNTGMRVGELAGLMWEDIILDEGVMIIRHSEKYDHETKRSYITTTKTGRERVFPITDEIKDLLERIKEYETDRGWVSEYVFTESEGRLTKAKISHTMANVTMSKDFTCQKSIHAIRRTFNSKLKCNGVSTTMASSLLGHSERINEQNYTYDVAELTEKKKLIEQIVTASNG